MELRHIRYFLAVADEGHFTRAAARLGIGQPPLSQQIRDLEREVGARLFHRVPQGAELTDAGRAFLATVASMPDQAAAAIRAAQRAERGEIGALRIGFTGSATLNPLVAGTILAFRRAFPEVELTLEEANSIGLLDLLADGRLDVAFLRPGGPGTASLICHELAEEPMIAALPSSHAAAQAGQGTIEIAALRDDPFILTPRAKGPTLFDAVIDACRKAGFEPALGQTAPQMASVLALVAAELGVSIVPASMRQLQLAGVAYRDLAGTPPVARLALARQRGGTSATLRNFIAAAMCDAASLESKHLARP